MSLVENIARVLQVDARYVQDEEQNNIGFIFKVDVHLYKFLIVYVGWKLTEFLIL